MVNRYRSTSVAASASCGITGLDTTSPARPGKPSPSPQPDSGARTGRRGRVPEVQLASIDPVENLGGAAATEPRLHPVRRHGGGRPRRGRSPPRRGEHVTRRRTRTPHGAVLESAPGRAVAARRFRRRGGGASPRPAVEIPRPKVDGNPPFVRSTTRPRRSRRPSRATPIPDRKLPHGSRRGRRSSGRSRPPSRVSTTGIVLNKTPEAGHEHRETMRAISIQR